MLKDYSLLDLNRRLILNLRDVGHTIHRLYEGKGSQRRILIILYRSGGMTQRDLTEDLGIQPGSVSEVIGKLEHAGLVERTRNEEDRRTANLRLTAQGQEIALQSLQSRDAKHREMLACLTEEEKETLVVLMEKLNEDWEVRYPMSGKGRGRPDDSGDGQEENGRDRDRDKILREWGR